MHFTESTKGWRDMNRARTLTLMLGTSVGLLAALSASATAQDGTPPVIAAPSPPAMPAPPVIAAPSPAMPAPPFATAPSPAMPPPVYVFGEPHYRSPGLAVALSLQPLPIDLGNFYAENLGWGVAYTAIEVSLLAPMMWMTGEHMNHGMGDDRTWSGRETGTMMGLVSGYIVVKVISGLHAGYAAQAFDRFYEPRTTALIAPVRGGALLTWAGGL